MSCVISHLDRELRADNNRMGTLYLLGDTQSGLPVEGKGSVQEVEVRK